MMRIHGTTNVQLSYLISITSHMGEKETKCFIINDKTKDELWVEFEITKSSETPMPCASNGVLVAGPLCELNVEVDKHLKKSEATQNMVLKLKGAYKEDFKF